MSENVTNYRKSFPKFGIISKFFDLTVNGAAKMFLKIKYISSGTLRRLP